MSVYYQDDQVTLHHGDALEVARGLGSGSVDCIVTSPPYFGLRDYGSGGQYGLEESPAEYVETMRALFSELRRVLADDGTLWLNLGDSYSTYAGNRGQSKTGFSRNDHLPSAPKGAGLSGDRPAKNLMGMPWRVAFALQDDGWILRNDIIWAKPNGMPESTQDRLSTKHEHVFMFSKSRRYWFDLDAIREPHAEATVERLASGPVAIARRTPGEKRDAHIYGAAAGTNLTPNAHFAVMPAALAERCIQAGCKPDGTVLDPFSGSGTTGLASARHGRKYVGIDISRDYLDLSLKTRLQAATLDFGSAS